MPTIKNNRFSSQYQQFLDNYNRILELELSLDVTRGKPSVAQLELSNQLLSISAKECIDDANVDARNYGGIDGVPEMKALFAELFHVAPAHVIVGGNSSLTMMYETLARACQFGVIGGDGPWNNTENRKFLCPTPGYDRHFLITQHLGFELIPVSVGDDGPDMDRIESLIAADETIKGIWCVPKYSNPTGCCYGKQTIERLANMRSAATDFRVMWDNAYVVHNFNGELAELADIAKHAELAGNPNRVIQFASTSKITHPGSGVAAMAGSVENITDARAHISVQSIGPDKINQLRHLKLFNNAATLKIHMEKHAALVKPKFDLVNDILEQELAPMGIAEWSKPKGGYFINLNVPDGIARRVVQLASEAGVKLTAAGAPFPYGKDPRDRNIRIAPTYPSIGELKQAIEVLVICIKLAVSEK